MIDGADAARSTPRIEAIFDSEAIQPLSEDLDGATTPSPMSPATRPLLVAAAAGGAVALSLGMYGRLHTPTGERIFHFGFSQQLEMKAWFATAALVLLQRSTNDEDLTAERECQIGILGARMFRVLLRDLPPFGQALMADLARRAGTSTAGPDQA